MFNIHTEMPLGNRSHGFDRDNEADALDVFDRLVKMVRGWGDYTADIVMSDERGEIKREVIRAAR